MFFQFSCFFQFSICSTKTAVAASQLCIGGFNHRGYLVFGILVSFNFLLSMGFWTSVGFGSRLGDSSECSRLVARLGDLTESVVYS